MAEMKKISLNIFGKSKRGSALTRLLMIAILVFLANAIASKLTKRIDLTEDKRFSLTDGTKRLLSSLDDIVYFKVYFDGAFPAELKKFKGRIKMMLDEFKAYSGNLIEYEFIDPSEGRTEDELGAFYKELIEGGLVDRTFGESEVDQYQALKVFPGAIMTYKDRERAVIFSDRKLGRLTLEELYKNEPMLEYKLANGISQLADRRRPKVAFLQGHGELSGIEIVSAKNVLSEFYEVVDLDLPSRQSIPEDIAAVVLARPLRAFRETEKIKIDQFLMNGGGILACIDKMTVATDSLQTTGKFMSMPLDLNLEDQLFTYGFRINPSLIQDINCNPVPLVVGYIQDQPQFDRFPWLYFPRIDFMSKHPITKGLETIGTEYVSTMDTVNTSGIEHTVLMTSSDLSRELYAPVEVSFEIIKERPKNEQFNKPNLPVALLVDGPINSLYKHRQNAAVSLMSDSLRSKGLKAQADFSSMIVVADGDFLRNEFSQEGRAFPLGANRVTGEVHANADFLLNAVEYLTDNSGLMESRGKEFKPRLLDPIKVGEQRTKWQALNLILPNVIVLLFGLVFYLVRIRRYAYTEE